MTEPESLEFTGINTVRQNGRTFTYFSGCDYLRLARDPRLARAARTALKQIGLSVAASRITTGNHKIYAQLEAALARFFGADSATVLPDGYFAPIVAAQAVAGDFDRVLIDEFAHGALRDAARMFDCPITTFKHQSTADLAKKLRQGGARARPIILTDGLFGHDGSVAPLREYLKMLPRQGLLLVDDAHGAGVIGATGKGSLEHEGVARQRIIQCATLSKGFGAYGGVILGSSGLRQGILERGRPFAGTTALPPPLAAAALEAVRILTREPGRRRRLVKNLSLLRSRVRTAGWDVPDTPGPIMRLPAMDEGQNQELRSRLLAAGIYPPFLKYGSASAGGYFRFIISSEHTRGQLENLAAVLGRFKTVR
jgi:8-amino-7-oxononanoate synthase